jgi:hypothetical protein
LNPSRRSKIIAMNPITRALLSLLLLLGGAALFYLLNRSKPKRLLFQAERKARLEARSILTRAETEELRIIQSINEHDEVIQNGYRMDIISITTPKIKEKQQARHVEFVKKNPMFKDAPPAPPLVLPAVPATPEPPAPPYPMTHPPAPPACPVPAAPLAPTPNSGRPVRSCHGENHGYCCALEISVFNSGEFVASAAAYAAPPAPSVAANCP